MPEKLRERCARMGRPASATRWAPSILGTPCTPLFQFLEEAREGVPWLVLPVRLPVAAIRRGLFWGAFTTMHTIGGIRRDPAWIKTSSFRQRHVNSPDALKNLGGDCPCGAVAGPVRSSTAACPWRSRSRVRRAPDRSEGGPPASSRSVAMIQRCSRRAAVHRAIREHAVARRHAGAHQRAELVDQLPDRDGRSRSQGRPIGRRRCPRQQSEEAAHDVVDVDPVDAAMRVPLDARRLAAKHAVDHVDKLGHVVLSEP